MQTLTINGIDHQFDAPDDMPLLWVIRDLIGLKGTKYGCGIGQCGACTVLIDGVAQRSCMVPVSSITGLKITTIEGADDATARAVRTAWQELAVPQCGYCQSGQIMAATDLLSRNPNPSDEEISNQMGSTICRCCTYHRVKLAVRRAADTLA
ncbi:MAG: (2Fe-2S)-binding protein [Candidatus Thiodiazotropha sp. (ex Monitilora ramsayi)]|nr:(2Fe-2S)-binding protein [Candidatus Thiodiazotropha sp. (ex Monitilora ramsayi)]